MLFLSSRCWIPVLLLGLAAALPARAGEVVLAAQEDATLIEDLAGAWANGSGPALFVGRTSERQGFRRRALVTFDVAGALPLEARIERVRLTLRLTPSHAIPTEIGLHRVLAPWSEGPSSSGGGGGATTVGGDVTWLHTEYDDRFWTAAGGDFSPQPSARITVGDTGAYTWGSTPGMVADIQSWLEDPDSNHGWLLLGDESLPTSSKRFGSREEAGPDMRPQLHVEFTLAHEPCEEASLRGIGRALCRAYCDILQCADGAAPREARGACAALARNFERSQDGQGTLPCEDLDRDGIASAADNCPGVPNPAQADLDADGVGDLCDNCPLQPNARQENTFGEIARGDACDCPCFTSTDVAWLLYSLQDSVTYEPPVCTDTHPPAAPLTKIETTPLDGSACSAASVTCGALSTAPAGDDGACSIHAPAPEASIAIEDIDESQRATCRLLLLQAADSGGLECD